MKRIITLFLIATLTLPLMGCKEEGPAEKAGKQIDQAYEDAKEKANKLFE